MIKLVTNNVTKHARDIVGIVAYKRKNGINCKHFIARFYGVLIQEFLSWSMYSCKLCMLRITFSNVLFHIPIPMNVCTKVLISIECVPCYIQLQSFC